MQFLIDYQWHIFIGIEILSVIALLLFGVLRYGLNQQLLSQIAIIVFLLLIIIEASLAITIYIHTKEIGSFQIIVGIFVIYACTFGIFDFIKLDRWMRMKISKWRGIELLTEKDYAVIKRSKDPKYIAKKYRMTSMIHLLVFLIVQSIFLLIGTENITELIAYFKDVSWFKSGNYQDSPYANQLMYSIGVIWAIVFIVDFVYSWSYTLFPSNKT